MSDLLALTASQFLALVCFASALAKTIQHPDPLRPHADRILTLSHTRAFALVEFALGCVLALPLPVAVQAGAALALAIVILDAQLRHAQHREQESDGFGSVTPQRNLPYFAIGAAVFAATTLLLAIALRTPDAALTPNRWVTALTLLVLLAITRKLGYDEARGLGYLPPPENTAATAVLPADLCVGNDTRGPLSAAELVADGRAALVVGVASQTPACRDVYALLANHARLLGTELNVVVIAPNAAPLRQAPGAALRALIDPQNRLSRCLGIHAQPYAVLLDHDLSLLAPPSQTSPKVQRLITLLVTTIQNAPKTLLSFDYDAAAARPAVHGTPTPRESPSAHELHTLG